MATLTSAWYSLPPQFGNADAPRKCMRPRLAGCAVHEITGQHVDTMLDFFEDTTHHDPHRWEKGWEGRGAAHAHTPAELVISGEQPKPREPEAGTAATARRLWPMGRQ